MSYIIRAYCDDLIKSVDLSKCDIITVGSDSNDTISFTAAGLSKAQISINKMADTFVIKGKHLYDCESSRVSSDKLEVGKRYYIDCEPRITLSIHPKQADSKTMLGIENIKELTIGRGRTNDIMLVNTKTSNKHCKIIKKDGLYKIKDLGSSNGTFVNGKRVLREKILNDGDIINISIYQILFQNKALTFYNVGNDMDISDSVNTCMDEESNFEEPRKSKSGTISMFNVENNCEIKSNKGGTISMFDLNISVNIDNEN